MIIKAWIPEGNIRRALILGWLIALMITFWQACLPNPHGSMNLINDKVLHVTAFLVLGIWAQIVWTQYKHRIILIGFLVFYGIAIECVQYFVPGRFFSLMDWLADILGLAIAMWLIRRMNRANNYSFLRPKNCQLP